MPDAIPTAESWYAVKANPAAEIAGALAALGANFDLASPGELDICSGLGIAAKRLSYGNTVKRERDIATTVLGRIGSTAKSRRIPLEMDQGRR